MAASGWRPVNVSCVESSRAPVFPTVDIPYPPQKSQTVTRPLACSLANADVLWSCVALRRGGHTCCQCSCGKVCRRQGQARIAGSYPTVHGAHS